ncbi:MAG: hypothetical protein PHS80_11080 [Methanothrix sp.]|nr:hypothetical protein [Methanothrix sp.]
MPGGAGHRLGGFSGFWTLGNDGDVRLLLADNYNQVATGQNHKAHEAHKGRTKIGLAILASATGSRALSAHRPHRVVSSGRLVAAAGGPGRPGLRRCCQGRQDFPTRDLLG